MKTMHKNKLGDWTSSRYSTRRNVHPYAGFRAGLNATGPPVQAGARVRSRIARSNLRARSQACSQADTLLIVIRLNPLGTMTGTTTGLSLSSPSEPGEHATQRSSQWLIDRFRLVRCLSCVVLDVLIAWNQRVLLATQAQCYSRMCKVSSAGASRQCKRDW